MKEYLVKIFKPRPFTLFSRLICKYFGAMAFPNFPPIKMHGTARQRSIVIGQKFEKKNLD